MSLAFPEYGAPGEQGKQQKLGILILYNTNRVYTF